MSRPTLFVSDLHLDPARAEIGRLFIELLEGAARRARALYILGDLFEVWVGDDARTEHSRSIFHALAGLARSGVPVFVMHGNRDFLLDGEFEEATECTLIPDPTVVDLYGTATLLMHGDTLCTDDYEYQAFRRKVRDPGWQRAFLAKPPEERWAIVAGLRTQSREETSSKPPAIMDVNPQAVIQAMHRHGVRRLIHGHTHRPGVHELTVDGERAQRLVLGDWYAGGSVLCCDERSCVLEELAPDH